jgi:hypothetical protein
MKRIFPLGVVGILLVSALLKLISVAAAIGGSHSLNHPEPILFFLFAVSIPMSWAAAVIAAIEIGVVIELLRRDHYTQILVIAMISTSFLLYHAGLAIIGYEGPCSCFGHGFGVLNIPEHTVRAISVILSLVMFLLSYGILSFKALKQRKLLA